MRTPARSQRKAPLRYAQIRKSFLGHLEGTLKATHTVDSYASDLEAFRQFLEREQGTKTPDWSRLTLEHLQDYSEYLKALGQKTNTRRRKLLTLRKLLRYLHRRKQFGVDLSLQLPTPTKLERKPVLLNYAELEAALDRLPQETELEQRNRLLVRLLLETGALISEVATLRWEHWNARPERILLTGKREREIGVSKTLAEELNRWQARVSASSPWILSGHNRFGSLGGSVSTRGIELAIRQTASALGVPHLVPRMLRQCAVSHWIQQGWTSERIQERLGLLSDYSLRVYFGHIQRSNHMNLRNPSAGMS